MTTQTPHLESFGDQFTSLKYSCQVFFLHGDWSVIPLYHIPWIDIDGNLDSLDVPVQTQSSKRGQQQSMDPLGLVAFDNDLPSVDHFYPGQGSRSWSKDHDT